MWKCKKCDGEVLKKYTKVEEWRVDRDLYVYEKESVNEYSCDTPTFICSNKDCMKESAYIERLAYWED